jgi:hypothetical protein
MAGSIAVVLKSVFDNKGLKKAQDGLSGLGDSMKKMVSVAAVATSITLVARAATDAAQAATQDAKSQALLANSMRNSANASDEQIASTENAITALARMSAVADDQIRPAMSTLVGVTHDVTKAQELTALSLDLAAKKGITVEDAASKIAKAYSGQTGALTKLMPELKGSTDLWGDLSKAVDGSAEIAANADPFARMTQTMDELQETFGYAVLPLFDALATWVNENQGTLGAIFEQLGTALVNVLPLMTPLLDLFLMILEPLGVLVSELMPPLTEIFGILIAVVTPFIGVLVQLIQTIVQAFMPVMDPMLRALKSLADIIIKYLVPWWQYLAAIFIAAYTPIAKLAEMIWSGLAWALDALYKALGPVFDALKPVLEAIMSIMGIKPIDLSVSASMDTSALDSFVMPTFDPSAFTIPAPIVPVAPTGTQVQNTMTDAEKKRQTQIQKVADKIAKSWQAAKDRVKKAKAAFRDTVSIEDAVTETAGGSFRARSAPMLRKMRKLIEGAKNFAKNITELKKKGADNALIQQLVDMGPGAGAAAAAELLSSGNLGEYMNLRTQLATIGTQVGEAANVAITGLSSAGWASANTAAQGMVNSNNNTYNINLNKANLTSADIIGYIRSYERSTGRKVLVS